MLVIGLTGGIASGKSTVSKMFEQAGVPVICADELAREAVRPGASALEEIRRVFGDGVIDSEGNLDRPSMARLVFRDPTLRKRLETIIHPWVSKEKDRRIEHLRLQGHSIVVVDVPLLLESGWEKEFDLIVVVYVPGHVQETRLIERDKMAPEDARARLSAQMPIEEKKEQADRLIDNSSSLDNTRSQVRALLREFGEMAKTKRHAVTDRSDLVRGRT